jgi:hypothetical protein
MYIVKKIIWIGLKNYLYNPMNLIYIYKAYKVLKYVKVK